MDPVALLIAALAAGATAAAKDLSTQAVKDGYAKLKTLIVDKFDHKADVKTALAQVEQKPDSENRKGVLREELQAAGADKDDELLKQAQSLLELLERQGIKTGVSFTANNTGPGAIAQGPRATAAGQEGIAVGGNVMGDIITGNNNRVTGRRAGEDADDVDVTGGVTGRDKTTA
jgi:hypothetical protein